MCLCVVCIIYEIYNVHFIVNKICIFLYFNLSDAYYIIHLNVIRGPFFIILLYLAVVGWNIIIIKASRKKNWMLLAVPLVGPCHSVHIFDALDQANDRVSVHAYFLFLFNFFSHFVLYSIIFLLWQLKSQNYATIVWIQHLAIFCTYHAYSGHYRQR